jgi:rRNA maturation endonuclease Nob1
VVLHFERPKHEVPGYFRKCTGCGRTFPWKHASCMYCGALVADK